MTIAAPDTASFGQRSLARRFAAEAIGTAVAVTVVVATSTLFGEGGNVAAPLLGRTLVVGAAAALLIRTFGPVSGAHLNPVVTLAAASQRGLPWREVPLYIGAQVIGAAVVVVVAASLHGRVDISYDQVPSFRAQTFGEFVAAFGLLAVIWGCSRRRATAAAVAVGAYLAAVPWFTVSQSFANPVVALARSVTDGQSGVRVMDLGGVIGAQIAGALAATAVFRWLLPELPEAAKRVVVPHGRRRSEEAAR